MLHFLREVLDERWHAAESDLADDGVPIARARDNAGVPPTGDTYTGVGRGSPRAAPRVWLRGFHREQPLLEHRPPGASTVRPLPGDLARHRPQDGAVHTAPGGKVGRQSRPERVDLLVAQGGPVP